ncbi:MAG: MFS transporter, partial [Gemmatimonadota bacterium]
MGRALVSGGVASTTPRLGSTTGLVVLLCGLNLLNYIDRQAVTGLLEPIRKDLGGTDAQMGLVGSAFVLTYTFMPPVFGWLGDRMARTKLLGISAAIWCTATAICGIVGSLTQLAGA